MIFKGLVQRDHGITERRRQTASCERTPETTKCKVCGPALMIFSVKTVLVKIHFLYAYHLTIFFKKARFNAYKHDQNACSSLWAFQMA